MTKRAEIKQADADRIAKAAAKARVKAELILPNGTKVVFSPADPVHTDAVPPSPSREIRI